MGYGMSDRQRFNWPERGFAATRPESTGPEKRSATQIPSYVAWLTDRRQELRKKVAAGQTLTGADLLLRQQLAEANMPF